MIEIYVKWVIQYLNKIINLKDYDNKIKNSNLHYIPINENEIDYYQKFSKPYLDFFYIRNDINLDKLTDEEKKFIEYNQSHEFNEEIEKFISITLDKVTKIDNDKFDRFLITYGAPSKRYLAYNDSLVIGFRFDEYNNDNNLSDLDWRNNYFDKLEYYNNISNEIKKIGREKLNKDISIIRYNEYTITKK